MYRSLEIDIQQACSDIIKSCVIVGHLRPSPALFLEPTDSYANESTWPSLKEEALRRVEPLMVTRYKHERITSPRMIHVLPQGSLPRTAAKGNIM